MGKATTTSFKDFGLSQPWIKPPVHEAGALTTRPPGRFRTITVSEFAIIVLAGYGLRRLDLSNMTHHRLLGRGDNITR